MGCFSTHSEGHEVWCLHRLWQVTQCANTYYLLALKNSNIGSKSGSSHRFLLIRSASRTERGAGRNVVPVSDSILHWWRVCGPPPPQLSVLTLAFTPVNSPCCVGMAGLSRRPQPVLSYWESCRPLFLTPDCRTLRWKWTVGHFGVSTSPPTLLVSLIFTAPPVPSEVLSVPPFDERKASLLEDRQREKTQSDVFLIRRCFNEPKAVGTFRFQPKDDQTYNLRVNRGKMEPVVCLLKNEPEISL